MKKYFLKLTVITGILILFLMLFTGFIIFNKDALSLRLFELMKYGKNRLGGIVINNTLEHIKIVDNNKIIELPPDKNSREIGVFDADLIVIEKPLFLENHKYSKGLIKLCDFATLKVQNTKAKTVIIPSYSYKYCKKFEPVGYFPSDK